MTWAIWSDSHRAYAHRQGRIVCFGSEEEAARFRDEHLVENNVAGQKDWWPADMERPVHRLYDETAHAEHHYWLWQEGEFVDKEVLPTPDYDRTDLEREMDERKMLGKPRLFMGMPMSEDAFDEKDDELDYWGEEFWKDEK